MLYELEPIRLTYLNNTLALDRSSGERNSSALLDAATDAPLALAVGGERRERRVPAPAGIDAARL